MEQTNTTEDKVSLERLKMRNRLSHLDRVYRVEAALVMVIGGVTIEKACEIMGINRATWYYYTDPAYAFSKRYGVGIREAETKLNRV